MKFRLSSVILAVVEILMVTHVTTAGIDEKSSAAFNRTVAAPVIFLPPVNYTVLSEGFEEAGTFPPTGWTLISINSGVFTWHQDYSSPHSGGYGASCEYMVGTSYQEECLQTPVLDLSGVEEPELRFWFKGSFAHSVTTNGCDLRVQISTDGGSTYPITLWSDDTADPFPENAWTEVTVSLIDFRIPDVTIRWCYIGSIWYQGDKFSIDDITVNYIPVLNICGDANGDDAINIADAVFLINYIFKGGPAPDPLCVGDANGDDAVNIADAVYLINYIFKSGPAPSSECCP